MLQRNQTTSIRARMILAATATAVAMLSASDPATANQPQCPCWTNAIELMDAIPNGEISICDAFPAQLAEDNGVIASVVVPTAAWRASAIAAPGGSTSGGRCSVTAVGSVEGIAPRDAWACVRDINTVCRGLSF